MKVKTCEFTKQSAVGILKTIFCIAFSQIFKITALYFVVNRKKEVEKGGSCKLAITDYPSHLMI